MPAHPTEPAPAGPAADPPYPSPEAAEEARPRLRLSHPRWLEERGEYGGIATACVDAEAPPTAATRVVFKAWAEWGSGRRMDLPDREGHIPEGGGTVRVPFVLDPPAEGGASPAACRYRFLAKHSLSEGAASGALEAGPSPDASGDEILFYSPAREEYLVVPAGDDLDRLLAEAERIRRLQEAAMRAWALPDPEARRHALDGQAPEAEALFGGKRGGDPDAAMQELLLVAGNPRRGRIPAWIRVRAHARGDGAIPVAGYWRKADHRMIQKRLDRVLTPQGRRELSPLLKTSFRANLLGPGPCTIGQAWAWRKKGGEEGKEGDAGGSGPEPFDFSLEAALGRYFAGFDGAEASFDAGKKKLRLGASGSASLSLFEGKVSLSLDLPDPAGVDLLAWLGPVKYRPVFLRDPRRECRIRLRLEGSLAAFAGLSVHGTLSVMGDFGKKPELEGGLDASAFAGAQLKLACQGALQWGPSRQAADFRSLAVVKYGAGLSAGLGAEGGFKIEWSRGVFRFHLSVALCAGLGLKGGVGIEIGAAAAVGLLGHLFGCVDFHFLGEVSAAAFGAYRDLSFAFFAREEAPSAEEGKWEDAKRNILARAGERSRLRGTPPEALGRLLAILMRTREPGDFRGIRYILGSTVPSGGAYGGSPAGARAGHKLKWTLRCVSAIAIPAAGGPAREAAKAEALRDGIRILGEFGRAEGEWKGRPGQSEDRAFTAWFAGFLEENGIRP